MEPFLEGEKTGKDTLIEELSALKKYIEKYFNAINLMAFSPPGAQIEQIPEKPDILLYIEEIESSGHLLMPGGLLQQPHIFMLEQRICKDIRSIFENAARAREKK